jgi:hypothetical protein
MILLKCCVRAWLVVLAFNSLQARAAEPANPAQALLVPPLAKAELSPVLRAAAERDNIVLAVCDVQSVASAIGDAVVIWVGTMRGEETQQWLIQLKRGIATPGELKANRGSDVKKYMSWGSVAVFHSEVDALDLWIAGPVNTSAGSKENGADSPLPAVRRTRVFVPRDYLRLGLDDSVRASQYMDRRIQGILKDDPKFGFGHIYVLDKPIKPENVAYAKPVAARIGFSPAMEQAWTGGYVALQSFYDLANGVPELNDIASIAMDRPAPWKLVKLAFGTNFKTFFGGLNAQLILDPAKAGLIPVALESLEAPFSFSLGDELIVSGVMAVTSPTTPLDVSAGILGLVAIHPKDKTRMVQLVAISASRAKPEHAQSH